MEWDEVEPILIFYCQYQIFFMGTNVGGSGGGASGGVTAFCLSRLGSNPEINLGFFQFRIAVNLFSLALNLI